jgi:hypothetical protein
MRKYTQYIDNTVYLSSGPGESNPGLNCSIYMAQIRFALISTNRSTIIICRRQCALKNARRYIPTLAVVGVMLTVFLF